MIVKMNGSVIGEYENGVNVSPVSIDTIESYTLDEKVHAVFRDVVIPASVSTGALSASMPAYASTNLNLADRLMPLINMIQDFALPVGIGVATWGLIEIIIGNFGGGKQKIKYAVIGFAGMFVIPEVFYAIKGAFA